MPTYADVGAERLGRYRLVALLGAGSYGAVHEVVDDTRGDRLALKRLRGASPTALARFKREFRSLRDLAHPGLVGLDELGHVDGEWYFTMELVDGAVDLARWLGGGAAARATVATGDDEGGDAGALPDVDVARAASALAQLADALAVVHAAGRLHCDLKPGNVLVDRAGQVRLCDFGLVADVGESTVEGTAWFMAPEQVEGQPLTPAADWYALGAMLFEIWAGRPPFVGTAAEVRVGKCAGPAPSLAAHAPEAPAAIVELVDGLLDRSPSRRAGPEQVRATAAALGASGAGSTDEAAATIELPLVGRADELASLRTAWAEAARGPVIVRVVGPSGIGKSALVRGFASELPDDVWVLAGRCYDREHLPLRALDPIVDALVARLVDLAPDERAALPLAELGALAQLFPVVRRLTESVDVAPGDLRRRAVVAARALLAAVARRWRVVLWLDDLQWSDAGSAELLVELLRDGPPLLCVAGCRSEDVAASPVLRALDGAGLAQRTLVVDALARPEAAELARRLGREADAGAIADEAAGSPFLIRELALTGGGAPRGQVSVDELVRDRVARLPPASQALLEAIALAGGPIAAPVARAAAAMPSDRATLAGLRAVGLVRVASDGDALDAYHDRVREAVLAGLAATAARAGHRRLADALDTHGDDGARVARHRHAAGDRAGASVAATRAARTALSTGTPERAAALFGFAAELADEADARRAARIGRGEALALAGRGSEAAVAFGEAAIGASALEARVLRRRAAELLLRAGFLVEGRAAARAVLAEHGVAWPTSPRTIVASLLWQRARLRVRGTRPRAVEGSFAAAELERVDALWGLAGALSMTDHLRGAELQARNLRAALAVGEPIRLSRSLALEAIYAATAGGRGRARSQTLIARAARLAERTGDALASAMLPLARGVSAHQAGEWAAAREHCGRAIAALEPLDGAFYELANARFFWLESLLYSGDVAAMRAAVPRLLDDAARRGDAYALMYLRGGSPSFRWIWEGQPERALAEVRAAGAELPRDGFHVPHLLIVLAETQSLLALGEGGAAWARLERDWGALERSFLMQSQNVLIEMTSLRGRAAVASGRSDVACAAAARLRRERMPWGDALAALLEAAVARTPTAWSSAAAACTAAGMPLHASAARDPSPPFARALAPR